MAEVTRELIIRTLTHICENDLTTYRSNQPRPDGKKPGQAKIPGSIWLTPKEMANTLLASMRQDESPQNQAGDGDAGNRVIGKKEEV